MESKDIQHTLDQLDQGRRQWDWEKTRSLNATAFNNLLKSVYARVRGQASPAVMRGLLELEIEIGGESGDYREFDTGQMVDLCTRGEVVSRLPSRLTGPPDLWAAVDMRAVARWIDAAADHDDAPSPAALRLVHAWLRLVAEACGLIRPEEGGSVENPRAFRPAATVLSQPVQLGQPYTEPATSIRFVFVPGGVFSMGDTFDQGLEDEKPVHAVRLSDYYMAAWPVTQAQWSRLMPQNPSKFTGNDHPVEQVTLADVMQFIDQLNAASPDGLRFDLPSEAQWEYAARSGGKDEAFAGGLDPDAVAWFEDNQTGGTAPVGNKAPNGLGLYDMSGNVWEWCRDIYHPEAYRRHEPTDPVWSRGGTDRVIRGGSWHLDAWSARCSRRFPFNPELFGPALGFRLVMVVVG